MLPTSLRQIRSLLIRAAERSGYQITRVINSVDPQDIYSRVLSEPDPIVDLEQLAGISRAIDGMISPDSGKLLYALCVAQVESGNVVEVGSWQGRSTSFLARATSESSNGTFFAIDHFRGNEGKEASYVVGKKDLSDLRQGFERNMRSVGLWDRINLLDMPNTEAASLVSSPVRFLFIDGDHTEAGVEADIDLFWPLLTPHAIVVFDDFNIGFDGLVRALKRLLEREKFAQVFSYSKTLVLVRGSAVDVGSAL